MTPISLGTLATIVDGTLEGDPWIKVSGFATDSSAVCHGDIFLAIRGARVDGHDFVGQALHKGAVASLVERAVDGPHVRVASLVQALAQIGRHFRAGFDGPVVGITGSAGKTTTKEFVAAAVSSLGAVLKTEGNRNTEYTSPLVWTDLAPETRAVVVEMAMRGFGQIAHLASVARPTVGLITNVGYAHLEQVGSREGIARAKGELLESLPSSGTAILWNDCEFLQFLRSRSGTADVRTFGFADGADCRITCYEPIDWRACSVRGLCEGAPWMARLPAIGKHVALDAAAAVLTAHTLSVDAQQAADRLSEVALPPMRMEVRHLGAATVLLDTYNASPPSMISAIETLEEMPVSGRRVAVLGEMRELGEYAEPGHRAVGDALRGSKIDEVLFVGENMRFALEQTGTASFRQGTMEEARELLRGLKDGDVALIKGSRALELERALD
jgi:UDP-N-acetylmuramoyl-tripeptide--D-alanyl-D-alanine ligase